MGEIYMDGDSYVIDGEDDNSGYLYRISLTKEEHINPVDELEITFDYEFLRGTDFDLLQYHLQFSGLIARCHRENIKRILENEVGIPSSALDDTLGLIFKVYDGKQLHKINEVEAQIRIETYHEVGRIDGSAVMERVLALSAEECLRPRPASREAVEALEKVRVTSPEIRETSCLVCLEEFEFGIEVTKMPCGHIFHGDCIVKWLEIRLFCPLCRFELPAAAADAMLVTEYAI